MIVLIFIIGGYICLLGLWGLFLVIVHLLQYRYNDTGLKFTYFLQARWELYNLETDLREQNNVSKENPEKVSELYKELVEWRTKRNAPIPTELNKDYLQ